ncbi:hypothetical protein J3F83DRAFT_726948 [Trichoderma novae-zelandiae]
MHTIEISAHARITLPCLALHAPLPPGPLWLTIALVPTCQPAYQIRRPVFPPAVIGGPSDPFFSIPRVIYVVQLSTAATIAYVVAPHSISLALQLHLVR